MKTYCGLEYSSKIKTTIINTINEAKENIFSNYFFIVDDPLFFEEAFFKYTDTLFNIQIINYQDLIKQLINKSDINVIDVNLAAGGFFQRIDAAKHRGLARARRP